MTLADGTMHPSFGYRDAVAAIDWLCNAFGFERRLVVPGEDGTIAHAELRLGDGHIMLGTLREDGATPHGSAYVYVRNVDAHYARARAAGATITRELEDQDYGGRVYSALDCEGHRWTFGTYEPGMDTAPA